MLTATAPVLVIGATGMLGAPVAEALIATGRPVRVMARTGRTLAARFGGRAECFPGDVRDATALAHALAGCRAVHVSLRAADLAGFETIEAEGARTIAIGARQAGLQRITYLSGAGIECGDPALPPVRAKQAAEAAIRECGVPFILLRATHFMESLDLFVRGDKAELLRPQPQRYHYLAARDFAAMTVRAIDLPPEVSGGYPLLGPEAFTMREALARYLAIARPDLTLREPPLGLVRLIAGVTRNRQLQHVTTLFRTFQRLPEGPADPAAVALFGAATTTLDRWCRERAAGRGKSVPGTHA